MQTLLVILNKLHILHCFGSVRYIRLRAAILQPVVHHRIACRIGKGIQHPFAAVDRLPCQLGNAAVRIHPLVRRLQPVDQPLQKVLDLPPQALVRLLQPCRNALHQIRVRQRRLHHLGGHFAVGQVVQLILAQALVVFHLPQLLCLFSNQGRNIGSLLAHLFKENVRKRPEFFRAHFLHEVGKFMAQRKGHHTLPVRTGVQVDPDAPVAQPDVAVLHPGLPVSLRAGIHRNVQPHFRQQLRRIHAAALPLVQVRYRLGAVLHRQAAPLRTVRSGVHGLLLLLHAGLLALLPGLPGGSPGLLVHAHGMAVPAQAVQRHAVASRVKRFPYADGIGGGAQPGVLRRIQNPVPHIRIHAHIRNGLVESGRAVVAELHVLGIHRASVVGAQHQVPTGSRFDPRNIDRGVVADGKTLPLRKVVKVIALAAYGFCARSVCPHLLGVKQGICRHAFIGRAFLPGAVHPGHILHIVRPALPVLIQLPHRVGVRTEDALRRLIQQLLHLRPGGSFRLGLPTPEYGRGNVIGAHIPNPRTVDPGICPLAVGLGVDLGKDLRHGIFIHRQCIPFGHGQLVPGQLLYNGAGNIPGVFGDAKRLRPLLHCVSDVLRIPARQVCRVLLLHIGQLGVVAASVSQFALLLQLKQVLCHLVIRPKLKRRVQHLICPPAVHDVLPILPGVAGSRVDHAANAAHGPAGNRAAVERPEGINHLVRERLPLRLFLAQPLAHQLPDAVLVVAVRALHHGIYDQVCNVRSHFLAALVERLHQCFLRPVRKPGDVSFQELTGEVFYGVVLRCHFNQAGGHCTHCDLRIGSTLLVHLLRPLAGRRRAHDPGIAVPKQRRPQRTVRAGHQRLIGIRRHLPPERVIDVVHDLLRRHTANGVGIVCHLVTGGIGIEISFDCAAHIRHSGGNTAEHIHRDAGCVHARLHQRIGCPVQNFPVSVIVVRFPLVQCYFQRI